MTAAITVLMAVYNGSAYLKECIGSVLTQSCRDFEFLIIDDGSTDATVEIIKSYNDKRIRLVQNRQNLSQVRSLNIGLDHARSEYVARMDADDIMLPGRLEKQLDFLRKRTDVALVGSWATAMDKTGNDISMARLPLKNEEIAATILFGEFILSHTSMMFRKAAILDVGRYNEIFSFTEDYKLATDLLLKGYRINNIPEPLIKYRLHDDRISVRSSKLQTERFLAAVKGFIKDLTRDMPDADYDLLIDFLLNAGTMNRAYWQNNAPAEHMKKIVQLLEILLDNVCAYFKFNRKERYFMKRVFFNRMLNFAYQGCFINKRLSVPLYGYCLKNWIFIAGRPKLYVYPSVVACPERQRV